MAADVPGLTVCCLGFRKHYVLVDKFKTPVPYFPNYITVESAAVTAYKNFEHSQHSMGVQFSGSCPLLFFMFR